MYTKIIVFATLMSICYGGYPTPLQYGVQSVPSLLSKEPEILNTPNPYNYGYRTVDNLGTQTTRQESGDGNGAVKGSYSYVDALGISRIVEYVADAGGFRASIKTTEPGTESSAPASASILSSPITVANAPASFIFSAPVPAANPSPLPSWPPRPY